MEAKRLQEIYLGFWNAKRQKAFFCQTVKKELGITSKEILSVKLDPLSQDEAKNLPRQLVKATIDKIRLLASEIALEKGLISIGNPIPKIGEWDTSKKLLEIGKRGHLLILQDEQAGNKKVTYYDPFKNSEFFKHLVELENQ